MAIKINGTTIIDDNRNISSVGIATVGSGSSITKIDGNTGIVNVGTGVTINGITGNISIAGTISAAGLNVPPSVTSFSPANGTVNLTPPTPTIDLTFDQWVGIGTTGTVVFRQGSPGGVGVNTLTVSAASTISRYQIRFTYSGEDLPGLTTVYPVFSPTLITSDTGQFVGINTGSGPSYSFTTKAVALGDNVGGGYLICQSSGTRWIVAPCTAEVARTWYLRNDAVTRAQQVTGRTGWFVPTNSQLSNPGHLCRTYWDAWSTYVYWSDGTAVPYGNGCCVHFPTGGAGGFMKNCSLFVRAFRCITY